MASHFHLAVIKVCLDCRLLQKHVSVHLTPQCVRLLWTSLRRRQLLSRLPPASSNQRSFGPGERERTALRIAGSMLPWMAQHSHRRHWAVLSIIGDVSCDFEPRVSILEMRKPRIGCETPTVLLQASRLQPMLISHVKVGFISPLIDVYILRSFEVKTRGRK